MNFDELNTIRVYGADWCGDCIRAKAFLDDNDIPFKFIDVEWDEAATKTIEQVNQGKGVLASYGVRRYLSNRSSKQVLQMLWILGQSSATGITCMTSS